MAPAERRQVDGANAGPGGPANHQTTAEGGRPSDPEGCGPKEDKNRLKQHEVLTLVPVVWTFMLVC